jgi:hypothetical protein
MVTANFVGITLLDLKKKIITVSRVSIKVFRGSHNSITYVIYNLERNFLSVALG